DSGYAVCSLSGSVSSEPQPEPWEKGGSEVRFGVHVRNDNRECTTPLGRLKTVWGSSLEARPPRLRSELDLSCSSAGLLGPWGEGSGPDNADAPPRCVREGTSRANSRNRREQGLLVALAPTPGLVPTGHHPGFRSGSG